MCPPKLCKCPKPTNRLLVLLAFVAKAAIASTTMWVTYDIGIWGTTEDTHQMYKNYCTLAGGGSFQRATKWDPPSCEAEKDLFKLPKYNQCDVPPFNIERNAFTVQNHWNRAVEIVFSGIAGFPYNVIGMFEKEVKEVPKCESSGDSLTIENKYKD